MGNKPTQPTATSSLNAIVPTNEETFSLSHAAKQKLKKHDLPSADGTLSANWLENTATAHPSNEVGEQGTVRRSECIFPPPRVESCYNPYVTPKQDLPPGPTDTNAFLLHNLLSSHECGYIMRYAAPHMRSMDAQYAQKHRKADRAMFRSKAMARELFGRILPMLVEGDYKQRTPLCFGHDGVWRPFGLNECLKVFRYGVGGEFVEHRDGPWVPREDQCSMYTVVLYLNEDFHGGSTVLIGSGESVDSSPKGQRELHWGQYKDKVLPSTGSALIFNHDCWHAGAPVKLGCKWILRTEIIFQRIHTFYVDRVAFASDEGYLAARELYASSMRAMEEGRREEFFEQYARVVGLQREAMLQVERSKQPQMLSRLDHDTFAHVLSFLSDAAIKALLTVNRKSFAAVVTSPHWQSKWEAQIKANNSLRGARRLEDGAFDHYKALRAQDPSNSPVPLVLTGGDYFTLYRQQLHLKKSFSPAALILNDPSALFIHNRQASCDENKFSNASRIAFETCTELRWGPKQDQQPRSSYRLSAAPSHYGRFSSGYPLHMNAPLSERFTNTNGHRIINPITGKPEWSVLTVPIDVAIQPQQVPLLIIPHPAWTAETEEANAVDALEAAFGLLRSPAVAMCHPAVCAMVGCFDLSVDIDGELDPDRTTTVIFVSEQGVHSFVVRDRTFAIVEQVHSTMPADEGHATSRPIPLPVTIAAQHFNAFRSSKANDTTRLIICTDNTGAAKDMMEELVPKTQKHGPAEVVLTQKALSEGSLRLIECPSFRNKCLFRY